MPCGVVPCRDVPCCAVTCRAVPCFAALSISYIPGDNASKHIELARASVSPSISFSSSVEPSFSNFFNGPFFTLYRYTETAVCTSMLWLSIRTASTAKQSAAQTAQSPLHKAANQVRADQSTYQKKYVSTCVLRPVCFPGAWSSWHFASRLFAPKMLDVSTYYIFCLSFQSILSCERAYRAEPPDTQSALYCMHTHVVPGTYYLHTTRVLYYLVSDTIIFV